MTRLEGEGGGGLTPGETSILDEEDFSDDDDNDGDIDDDFNDKDGESPLVMSRCSSPTMTEKDGGREGGGQCPPPPRSYRWQFSDL